MKNILVLVFLVFFCDILPAQESFSHSVGAGGFIGTRKASLHAIGVVYSPRLNLINVGKSSTLSLGANFGIGYNVDNNFIEENQITFHIPIIIDYNFGLASSNKAQQNKSGGFLGIGYSFEQTGERLNNGNFNDPTLIKKFMNGPLANIGYRFKIGSKPFVIRLSYLYGTGDFEGGYLTTLSLQYIFK
ncbi:hypothetical protein [Snuella lapsa]|uniref:Outer membrane protein beta-barrel domain-containing protein n=1 Tax=Snuella lapsa TaxID=870481 RepID=A0ABP6X2L2_9FLAO